MLELNGAEIWQAYRDPITGDSMSCLTLADLREQITPCGPDRRTIVGPEMQAMQRKYGLSTGVIYRAVTRTNVACAEDVDSVEIL